MDKEKILNELAKGDLSDAEVIDEKENYVLARFYYDFEDDEIEAAKAYSNDECEEETEGDKWFQEYYIPYLQDLGVDSVSEVLEDMSENMGLNVQYISYEIDKDNLDYQEFIALFAGKQEEIDIDKLLDELEL